MSILLLVMFTFQAKLQLSLNLKNYWTDLVPFQWKMDLVDCVSKSGTKCLSKFWDVFE